MKEQLSKVYFDGQPVTLMGDEARPPLSRIVRAGGQVPGRVDVLVLTARDALRGKPLAQEEIIDRTAEPTKPIYLRSIPKGPAVAGPLDEPWGFDGPSPIRKRPRDADPSTVPDRDPMSNADATIAQLGATPQPAPPGASPRGLLRRLLGLPPSPEVDPVVLRTPARRLAEEAEAAAEERQEEERDQQNAMQDEDEERAEADKDERLGY